MLTRCLKVLPLLVLVGCVTTIVAVVLTSSTAAQARLAALPATAAAPADNPSTPERVALGRLLFWDPILSGQKDVACATCHHPAFGYSDGLDLSIGANGAGLGPARAFAPGHAARLVKRNSQTILNVAFNGLTVGGDSTPAGAPMFWDLRVRSLEAQALEPLKALDEMRGSAYPEDRALPAVVSRLNAIPEYRRLFARAFGGNRARDRSQPRARARGLSADARRRQYARSIATCAATPPRSAPSRSAAWSGSSRWDASTATTGRCSRTSSRTCWRCPTTAS